MPTSQLVNKFFKHFEEFEFDFKKKKTKMTLIFHLLFLSLMYDFIFLSYYVMNIKCLSFYR
jgi:hypothetical protein